MVVTTKIDGKESVADITYSDFGSPISADAPPANEVKDAPDLVYQVFANLV